ncbi:CDP-diacylglycerol--glycerol-3-phosphate 3-phosphatidyltransferase [Rhizina undulata]
MIITTRSALLRATGPLTTRRVCLVCSKRSFTTFPPPPPPVFTTPKTSGMASMLAPLTVELDKLAPRFEIQSHQIQIIRGPAEFYSTLKERILKAKKRIFLATLYIGKTEHELIETIRQALLKEPELKVSILSDALRGTRETPNPSCASLLAPLVKEFGTERVEIRMYHTPNFRGLKKKVVPKRLNEGWGLQHMKLYGIDDEIIISGANLSSDYFTNRQDRYHLFSCPNLTGYFAGIHNAVCSISYRVLPGTKAEGGYRLEWPETNPAPLPTEEPIKYKIAATALLEPLIRVSSTVQDLTPVNGKTIVYPLAQFTPLLHPADTSTEHPGLSAVLSLLSREDFSTSRWMFTAGYFNIQPALKELLLASRSAQGTVLTAAPEANGFYGSKGVSNMLPPAYTLLARRFLKDVNQAGKGNNIELREWRRGIVGKDPDAWTYHAKGVWVTLPNEENPSITLVGSSNYTKRSYSLDLEVNTLVVTEDEKLKKQLGEEVKWLKEDSKRVTKEDFERTERRVSWRVRVAMWIVGAIGGQL